MVLIITYLIIYSPEERIIIILLYFTSNKQRKQKCRLTEENFSCGPFSPSSEACVWQTGGVYGSVSQQVVLSASL